MTVEIPNLCWNALKGAYQPTPWYCIKELHSMKMVLHPNDKREIPEYWECTSCKRRISIDRRDKTFEEVKEQVKQMYSLRTLEYVNGIWTIESDEWQEDRLSGRVKPVRAGVARDIRMRVKELLEDNLEIEIETIKDYFIE